LSFGIADKYADDVKRLLAAGIIGS
jgi:hypothetical protein